MSTVLRVKDVTMQFGGVVAIDNLSMHVDEGEIVALIGPNGAGKTTAFNCITGVYEPTNGEIAFGDCIIARSHPTGKMKKLYAGAHADKYLGARVRLSPDKITRLGIARTFQNIRLFKSQTAFENVLIATHLRRTSNPFTATLHINAAEERRMRERAMEMLETVGLADSAGELATSLPYGQQRRLEIARALATQPKLLLLDEPAAGMNPQETDELGAFTPAPPPRFQLTVFMIEHHMNLVMDISDRIYVIDFGRQIAEGAPAEVRDNPAVIAAYLGVDEE